MKIAFQKQAGDSSLGIAFTWRLALEAEEHTTVVDSFIPELFFDFFFVQEGCIECRDEACGPAGQLPEPLFDLSDLAEVKQSGGLNNDWDLTFVVINLLFTLVDASNLDDSHDPWVRYRQTMGSGVWLGVSAIGIVVAACSSPTAGGSAPVGTTTVAAAATTTSC